MKFVLLAAGTETKLPGSIFTALRTNYRAP